MQLRWNSNRGRVLGTVRDGSRFSKRISVPKGGKGVVVAVSRGRDGRTQKAAHPVAPDGDRRGKAGPSEWSASGDLWGRFGASGAPTELGSTSEAAAAAPGLGGGLVAGIALLGLGTVVLLAGFAVAQARRRRMPTQC